MSSSFYLNPNYNGPMILESYLKKLKNLKAKALFISRFTKRWFTLNLNTGVFSYKKKESDKNPHESHNVNDLIGFDPNPRVTIVSDWKFLFSLEFNTRTYTLYTDSLSTHNQWCLAFKALLTRPNANPATENLTTFTRAGISMANETPERRRNSEENTPSDGGYQEFPRGIQTNSPSQVSYERYNYPTHPDEDHFNSPKLETMTPIKSSHQRRETICSEEDTTPQPDNNPPQFSPIKNENPILIENEIKYANNQQAIATNIEEDRYKYHQMYKAEEELDIPPQQPLLRMRAKSPGEYESKIQNNENVQQNNMDSHEKYQGRGIEEKRSLQNEEGYPLRRQGRDMEEKRSLINEEGYSLQRKEKYLDQDYEIAQKQNSLNQNETNKTSTVIDSIDYIDQGGIYENKHVLDVDSYEKKKQENESRVDFVDHYKTSIGFKEDVKKIKRERFEEKPTQNSNPTPNYQLKPESKIVTDNIYSTFTKSESPIKDVTPKSRIFAPQSGMMDVFDDFEQFGLDNIEVRPKLPISKSRKLVNDDKKQQIEEIKVASNLSEKIIRHPVEIKVEKVEKPTSQAPQNQGIALNSEPKQSLNFKIKKHPNNKSTIAFSYKGHNTYQEKTNIQPTKEEINNWNWD